MNWVLLIVISTTGALIGWITNVLAIYLLFRPYQAISIPLVSWEIQGVLPKRRKELARNISEVVETQLLPLEEIVKTIADSAGSSSIGSTVAAVMRERIMERLPGFLPSSLKDTVCNYFSGAIQKEMPDLLLKLKNQLSDEVRESFDIRHVVETKINSLEMEGLEQLVLRVARRELRYIELLGAFLGFLVGLVQFGIISVLGG